MADLTLQVEGMTCGSCAARVDRALHAVHGVHDAAVNLTTGVASVRGEVSRDEVIKAVDRAGYTARLLEGDAATTLREVRAKGREEEQAVLWRLWIGFLAGTPMLLIDVFMPQLMALHSPTGHLAVSIAQVLLATVVMAIAGRPFFVGAWRAMRHGSANMDLLVALGSGVAFVYSIVLEILRWSGRVGMHDYHSEFHAAATIIVLVTLGKYLEARAKRRASSAVGGLAVETAASAMRVGADGTIENVAAEQLAIGDRLQVLAHQRVPVDGEVLEGAGSADLSVVTGESMPVEVTAGTALPGGALLLDGRVVLRATSTAAASTVARILELVNAAQASKTQIQALADRVAGIFVPIVLVLAAVTFAGWMLMSGSWEKALVATIATVVIACPCAMGLATPTAITVALGTAARMGVLFTRAAALERARQIGVVIFDKTGTLTEGRPHVAEVVCVQNGSETAEDLLRLAASAEQFSEHPLAKAVVSAARERRLGLLEPMSFSSVAGAGVKAAFEGRGEYFVGSVRFAAGESSVQEEAAVAEVLASRGMSVVAVGFKAPQERSARVIGLIGLRDELRSGARETIQRLRNEHVRVGVLTGDTEAAVRGALEGIKVDWAQAGVKPDEKAEVVRRAKGSHGGVAFVGDGINDGPALAAADLGIAMAGGTDLAKAAGDVLLVGNQLSALPALLDLSRRTLRVIRQNLFWAFAYNVAAIPLAMAGILPPGVAAAAMMLSSLTVVFNALRLRNIRATDH